MPTHEVTNQAPPLVGFNAFLPDRPLRDALIREGAGYAEARVSAFGAEVGSEDALRWAAEANESPPRLHTHDRTGNRRDEVEFHPSWHHLMRLAVGNGLHGAPWADARAGAHVARAAMFYLDAGLELGHGCPISMTYSAVPALRGNPELSAVWEPRLTSLSYDPSFQPAERKTGALCGMAMTEKQGGSDVRANTTRAEALADGTHRIVGHKWFCSAPMCDAFLALAQEGRGLSCFLLPRWLPDGTKNALRFQRLKNKLGNKSNASSEVEFEGALGWRVGDEGRGVPTIIDMVAHTRLDCVIGSTGMIRAALAQAIHHTRHRSAFGKALLQQPLMRSVLADLAIEAEASTALMMRLARAYDERTPEAEAFRRVATPIAKFHTCKRAIVAVAEALECLGGNGYTEDFPLARLHRETPLYSIWEGSGNVIALDVLRALRRTPPAAGALMAELRLGAGDPRLDAMIARVEAGIFGAEEAGARGLVEAAALALQGSLLRRFAPAAVSDAFLAARIGAPGLVFGDLPPGIDTDLLLERAWEG